MNDKYTKVVRQLSNIPRALHMVWEAAPGWTTAWAALILLQGLLPVATVYLTKALVDSLSLAIGPGSDPAAFTTACLLYTSPSPRDGLLSRMPSSA